MQVSLSKKIIDELVEKYGCTENEAVQAYLNAQNRAQEAFQESMDEILGIKNIESKIQDIKIFSPGEIKAHLDKFIIGQEEYKKRICIAAAYHFAMVHYIRTHPGETRVKRFRKKNTIIAGPSGSGKTYCAEVMGDLLQVPTLIIDSTDYTEAGYVGKSADDMIRELIDMAPGGNVKEQARFISDNGGIIFIDEIDKKAKESGLVGHDISREGFQRSVLKLMERKYVSVENPYSPAAQIQEAMMGHSGGKARKDKMISTENILFILGGSFERAADNLDSIVRKRIEHAGNLNEEGRIIIRGFSDEDQKKDKEKYKNYIREADADDYIHFGLLPELVGRAPIRTFVNLLSKNDLIRIMQDTEDSILHQYELEFQLFGIELKFEVDAVSYVAEIAENKKTGARALVSVWENILTDFQFELPGSNFKSLKITGDLCLRPKDVLLHMIEKSPFLDYIESFKNEYGIELQLDSEAEKYVEEVALQRNLEVSATIKDLLKNASALNYMHHQGPFSITRSMLEDPKYFDKLFTEWYRTEKEKEKES